MVWPLRSMVMVLPEAILSETFWGAAFQSRSSTRVPPSAVWSISRWSMGQSEATSWASPSAVGMAHMPAGARKSVEGSTPASCAARLIVNWPVPRSSPTPIWEPSMASTTSRHLSPAMKKSSKSLPVMITLPATLT